MKSRLSSFDIWAICLELQKNAGKSILLKFNKTDFKLFLLVEPGVRLHETVAYQQEDARAMPGGFVAKLRKHLRNRRLTNIRQVGFDRIVELEFGTADEGGEGSLFLYLEFYSLGNIVLTDNDRKVIALSRVVNNGNIHLALEEIYQLNAVLDLSLPSSEEFSRLVGAEWTSLTRKRQVNALRPLLSCFSPAMIDFIISKSPSDPYPACTEFIQSITCGSLRLTPYLQISNGQFVDFSPISLNENGEKCESVNLAAEKFFGQIESAQAAAKDLRRQHEAESKLKTIEDEQKGRISSLENLMEELLRKAKLVEANVKIVEAASLVIRICLENDMNWDEISELLEEERRAGRQTAQAISTLKLEHQCIALTLHNDSDYSEDVDINIYMSGHANATMYYDQRKQAAAKLERTIKAHEDAIKSAAAKIKKGQKQQSFRQSRARLQKARKVLWFERFAWFISSDNYLVIGGRDSQQNEQLVKKYMGQSDVYVHAEISGASSVIIRNHLPEISIPPRTLSEAGCLAICMSRAWEAKIVVGAWWVSADQVSKTAPSGEYLGTGSFMIRGHKHFLPPSQLQLGFGFMFVTNDETVIEKNRAKRLQREDARKQAQQEGSRLEEDSEILDTMKKYESMMVMAEEPQNSLIVDEVFRKPMKQKIESEDPRGFKSIQPQQQPRGRKGKMKKIKSKYADQDEEERADRMRLLGSMKPPKEAKLPQKTKEPKAAKVKAPLPSICPEIAASEGKELEAPPEVHEFSFLDQLVGAAQEEQEFSQAIPVCGPWSIIRNYTHRVKFAPGPQKKGKLVKSSMSVIQGDVSEHLRTLIRNVPDTDLVQVIPVRSASLSLTATESSQLKKVNKKKK